MKKLLTLATVALVALAMGVTAHADPQPESRTIAALQRRVTWDRQHIRQLQHRRAYLHRYIRRLRNPVPATPVSSGSTPSSAGSTAPSTVSTGGWSDELRAVGFPESAIPHMLYIIDRESGGCPTAVNGLSGCPSYSSAASFLAASTSHACGLIQAYPCSGGAAWLDPMTNLRVGFQKYQASGFAPWGG